MKRYIFGALLLVPLVALGYAIKQKDDGSLCFEKDSVDEWCISSTGNVTFDGTLDLAGEADGLVLDADGDTTFAADTDDQIDVEVNGTDVLTITNGTGGAHAYVMEQAGTHSFDRNVVGVWDDFLYQTIAETDTPWILNAGGDAQAIDPAINAQEGGVIRATTGDADGTVANDGSQLISHVPMQADSGGMVFEARLHINSAVTDISVCAGFTDTTSLEEPFSNSADTITSVATDAVAFCYDTDATTDEWWALGVDSDTDATGNAATGTAPTADTYQVLRIEIDSDGESARLYIDGALEVSLTADVTANSVDLHPMVIANATTTTSKTVDVDYIYAGTTR